jgi:hypothetical protein
VKKLKILAVALSLSRGACEFGAEQSGPHKAFFLLKLPDGQIERFYLGGYNRMADCLGVIEYETVDGRPDGLIGAFCLNEDEYTLLDQFVEN